MLFSCFELPNIQLDIILATEPMKQLQVVQKLLFTVLHNSSTSKMFVQQLYTHADIAFLLSLQPTIIQHLTTSPFGHMFFKWKNTNLFSLFSYARNFVYPRPIVAFLRSFSIVCYIFFKRGWPKLSQYERPTAWGLNLDCCSIWVFPSHGSIPPRQ